MKKLFVLAMLLATGLAQAKNGYDIWVKNDTGGNVKVEISVIEPVSMFCQTPNGGDTLTPAKHEDFWPTHNWCFNNVKLTYPDGSQAEKVADKDHNRFRAYKVEKKGPGFKEIIEYHWEPY